MIRVLHYIPSIDKTSGGVGAFMQLLSKQLGLLVDLHIVTHRSANELLLENCAVHYMTPCFLPWTTAKKEFNQLLNELKPDVFHTNCCWLPLSAMTQKWAKAKGLKTVYSPHGMLEPWIVKRHYWTKKLPALLLFQKRAIKVADLIHSTAESEKDNLLKLGYNTKIRVIPNCVEIDDIRIKESWERNKVILFLSRVHVKKGIEMLISAVAKLKEQMSGYCVRIAGPGDESYIAELKRLANDLGVGEMVQFVGPVFGSEKYNLYREADLFVLPTHSENFGIVVVEALASGTPVVTTVGTPWNELTQNDCGWWINIGVVPLIDALNDFLTKDIKDLERMGRNGRNLVEQEYCSTIVARQFVEMYENLIN